MRGRTPCTTCSRREHGRHGATTVELALVLPVLFIIVFGSFEFSRLNMLKHLAEVAAYEGAYERPERLAVLVNADGTLSAFHSVRAERVAAWGEYQAATRALRWSRTSSCSTCARA